MGGPVELCSAGGKGASPFLGQNLAPRCPAPQASPPLTAAAAPRPAPLVMLAKLLLALIRIYQLTLSKLILATLGPVCRFEPSCSRYAVACIQGHGALRGSLLSVKRLCRCHPFHPGGFDPPPPPRPRRDAGAPALSSKETPSPLPWSRRHGARLASAAVRET
jgi:putative membrane protein insertion efficiency factor